MSFTGRSWGRESARRCLPCSRSPPNSIPSALALHFFYLNVGAENDDYLARVEIPAWVAENPAQLDTLHAVLISQCRMLGPRPYPYLLHRCPRDGGGQLR